MSFLITLLAPVAGVELVFFWSWSCYWSKRWYFFFSLQAFLLEVSLLLAGKELDSFDTKSGGSFLTGLSRESWVEEVCDLAMMEWASQLPYRQRWSFLYRIDCSYRLVFALALIDFFMSPSQLLYFRFCCSIWAFINGLRLLQKNQIRSDSFKALSSSNSWRMGWRCSRWETQSCTSFCWNESHVWLCSRLCQGKLGSHRDSFKKKLWNLSRVRVLPNPNVCASSSENWSAYEEKRQQMGCSLS